MLEAGITALAARRSGRSTREQLEPKVDDLTQAPGEAALRGGQAGPFADLDVIRRRGMSTTRF